jgi:signal transduction histidine kinase
MNYEAYRILIVDENPADRQLTRLVLSSQLSGIQIREVDASTEFAEALLREQFDVVITERRLSWADGADIVGLVRRTHAHCVVMLFTATASDLGALRWSPEQRPDARLLKDGPGYIQLPEAVRRQIEQRFSRETRAAALISRLPAGVFALSAEGRIVFSNAAAALVFDSPVARVLGQPLTAFFADAAVKEEIHQAIAGHQGIRGLDGRLVRRDEVARWARVRLWVANDDQGIAFEGLLDDVSERKLREDSELGGGMQTQEADTDRERFAATVAHELQAPIGRITRYAQLLTDRHVDALGADPKRLVEQILGDGRRLQGLLDELLDYARVGAKRRRFEPVDFAVAVDEAASSLEAEFKETGGSLLRDELPVLRADRGQIVRLFQNLISNSLKSRAAEPPEIQISATRRNHGWCFAVKDNGVGIPPADHERVFQLFQRLPQLQELPGTGVGLTICRSIVERHGGRIWLESEPGKGSTFFFTVPSKTS